MNIFKPVFMQVSPTKLTARISGSQSAFHPATQIIIWICTAFAAQAIDGYLLVLVSTVLILFSGFICLSHFYAMLLRVRWILFSILLIYAYTGQGNVVWSQLGVFSPHAEGVLAGTEQLLRLISVLAGLSVLLTRLSQSQFMEGLYVLSRPLDFLGLSRQQFVVRLALTMRYIESVKRNVESSWLESIEQMILPLPIEQGSVELNIRRLTWRDLMLIAVALLVTVGLWS
jgi:energy-coupling factor transporter transmembrane protein EcfT